MRHYAQRRQDSWLFHAKRTMWVMSFVFISLSKTNQFVFAWKPSPVTFELNGNEVWQTLEENLYNRTLVFYCWHNKNCYHFKRSCKLVNLTLKPTKFVNIKFLFMWFYTKVRDMGPSTAKCINTVSKLVV